MQGRGRDPHEDMKDTKRHEGMYRKRVVNLRALRVFVNTWPGAVGLVLAMSLGRVASAEVIDRVLAVVAGTVITLSDVNAARELGLVAPGPAADPIRAILSRLIDRELELAEVDRYAPPEPTAAEVDRQVEIVRGRFPSEEAFTLALSQSGFDRQHLRETLREDLRIRAYLAERFSASDDRRDQVISDWLVGLRRRAEIIDLYVPGS